MTLKSEWKNILHQETLFTPKIYPVIRSWSLKKDLVGIWNSRPFENKSKTQPPVKKMKLFLTFSFKKSQTAGYPRATHKL